MMDSEDEDDVLAKPLLHKPMTKAKLKSFNPPRGGLVNSCKNSYACAVFELLFSLPPFVEWLGKSHSNTGSVRQSLAELYNTQCSKQLLDPDPIISRIGCYEAKDHCGDAHLFFCDVINTLCVEEESYVLCDIREMFCGVMKVSDKCSECHFSSEENHLNLAYPIYLDKNTSIQQGLNEYDSPQIISSTKCQVPCLQISQTITCAPNILSLKVQDIVGAPTIDLTVKFGGCTYELTGLIINQFYYFQTISKCGPYWLHYKDASVKSIKVGQLFLNNEIEANLHLAVYCKVFDVNQNHQDNTATNIIWQESVEKTLLAAGNECDSAKNESEELIEDFTFLFHEDVAEASVDLQNVKSVVWSPKTPTNLTAPLAVAEVFTTLDNFDPLLSETDVEGAVLPYPVDDSFCVKQLTRWLKCRGASTAKMSKAEMIKRINSRMENKTYNVIDPSIDKFKWYNQKKKELEEGSRPPFLPLVGWGAFPSCDILNLFNWGHAHVYLVETAPNWSTAFNFSDDEDECFSQDVAHTVGQTNIPNKGKRFLLSDHLIEVMDCRKGEFYFVKGRIQASMANKIYFTSVTIRIVSGSVRYSTCYCKQRSLGRCSHVAALLMYVTRHIEERGYGALSCTDRACSWGHGSKNKDPGLITKTYKKTTNPMRSCFSPLPTAEQHKTDEELMTIKDNFLKSVQRLYVTEPKQKAKKKSRGNTSGKNPAKKTVEKINTEEETEAEKNADNKPEDDFEYIFDLHLEFSYESYSESVDNVKLVIQMCKIFAKERFDISTIGPIELPDTSGQSKSTMWHSRRCFYFPSSISKRIFHMTPTGYKNFLREHLWQMKEFRGNAATTYGNKNEPKAREDYLKILKNIDPSVEINTTGMWTNSSCPEFSCSPDGIITRNSGKELLEVKCPYLLRAGNPNEFDKTLSNKQKKSFCLHNVNGKVTLKKNHQYYHQIQMAMGITETYKCHFVVWSPKDMFYEEVTFDPSLFFAMKRKMGPLFWKLLVPEYFFMRTPRRLDPYMLHYSVC